MFSLQIIQPLPQDHIHHFPRHLCCISEPQSIASLVQLYQTFKNNPHYVVDIRHVCRVSTIPQDVELDADAALLFEAAEHFQPVCNSLELMCPVFLGESVAVIYADHQYKLEIRDPAAGSGQHVETMLGNDREHPVWHDPPQAVGIYLEDRGAEERLHQLRSHLLAYGFTSPEVMRADTVPLGSWQDSMIARFALQGIEE